MQKITDCTPQHPSRTSRFAGFASLFTGLAALFSIGAPSQAFGANSVSLAWNASASPTVVGYRIHFGGASRNYTNSVTVGSVTSSTIPNLRSGGTYYFATTARDVNGLESEPSNEVVYTVPAGTGGANLRLSRGASGQVVLTVTGNSGSTHELQYSTNLITWTVLNTLTLGASGSNTFTDSAAPNRTRRFYRTRTSP